MLIGCPDAPYCLVLNHHSGWDPLLVTAVAPLAPRITWFGPKEADLTRGFRNKVIDFFGAAIPFDPAASSFTAVAHSVRRVFQADGVLGIFAEGQVGFCETELLPFKEGAVIFATASKVPIVPAAIVGSTYLWLGRRVEVRFGDPISDGRRPRACGSSGPRAARSGGLRGAAARNRAGAARASARSACWATCSPGDPTSRAGGRSSASSRTARGGGPG